MLFELKFSQMVVAWSLVGPSDSHVPGESQLPAGALVQLESLGGLWKIALKFSPGSWGAGRKVGGGSLLKDSAQTEKFKPGGMGRVPFPC